jgi:tetratricopeptide (TPR) repeat protein
MKQKLWLFKSVPAVAGLLAFALLPAFAQQPSSPTGKIHGHVTNPTGQPQSTGAVSLTTDGGATLKFTFQVDSNGDYSGEAAPGTYDAVYRNTDTPPGKIVDDIKNVKIVVGTDIAVDVDMSRQEYIDKMPADQKKQLEDLKAKNAEAIAANKQINTANADLKTVIQDKKDIDGASEAARQQLGASASSADVTSKANEIKAAKYADIQTMMTKDIQVLPNEALLYTNLAYSQAGQQKYDDAITTYKKALDLENAAKKPRPDVLGVANAGMGECYARTGKVPEANAAYDAAAKADPARAAIQLRNEAIIFFQMNNSQAQVAAADEAITANPTDAILYYIKGQGLIVNATVDAKGIMVLPPGCAEAYQKYLDLAPKGQFADEVAGILQQAGQKVSTSYHAPKSH